MTTDNRQRTSQLTAYGLQLTVANGRRTTACWVLIMLMTTLFTLSSCNKTDENGDFDGHWQMTEWKSNATGEILATRYTRQIYYAVKLNILQMRDYDQPYDTWHLSYFHRTTDSLYIDKVFHRPFDREEPADSLAIYGCAPEGRYAFIKLTHDDMILRNSLYTLTFKKH